MIDSETIGFDNIDYVYDSNDSPVYMTLNGTPYYYQKNLQGDIIGIVDSSNTEVVTYTYDAWGELLSVSGTLASTVGEFNRLRYRGYYYDTETGIYYLQSRYYNPEIGRFISEDDPIYHEDETGAAANLYAYCGNNPVNMVDEDGHKARASYWSFKCDWAGTDILWHYLFGNGKDFVISDKGFFVTDYDLDWIYYMMDNKTLREKVKKIVFPIGKALKKGKSKEINITTKMVIENGEDIIGYQYLHGTNAKVGGFKIQGKISKAKNGDVIYKLTYTWNDIIDPNPKYISDQAKAKFAKKTPFANPKNYKIKITWSNKSIIKAKPGWFFWQWSSGWLSEG